MNTEIDTLKGLYIAQLKDLSNAEAQIVQALPKIIRKATSPVLKKGLEDHLAETMLQVERLNRIFETLGKSPRGKRCLGMEGVLEEGKEVMAEKMASPNLMDAALIGSCQKVEHYEISSYGTARAYADLLGEEEAVELLSQSLEEEKAADKTLTQIGMNIVNLGALEEQEKMNRQDALS